MSSVTWILLPFKTPAFRKTSSRSLNSSKVTTTGRHPTTSGPVITREAHVTVMSLLMFKFVLSILLTFGNITAGEMK